MADGAIGRGAGPHAGGDTGGGGDRPEDFPLADLLETLEPLLAARAVRDADGRITDFEVVFANQAAHALLGLPDGAVVGHRVHDLFPEPTVPGWFDLCRAVVDTGEKWVDELHLGTADRVQVFETTVIRFGDGILTRAHDVTDRNHFGAAVDAAPIGMAIVALDSTFLAVNTALCALTGRTAEWLREHRTGDVLHAEDRHLEVEARERALEEAQPQRVEVRVERADGSRTWVEQSIAVLDDATGPRRRVPRRFVDGAGTWVVQYVDVDDDHAERERLNYQATHDALTRVGNRHTLVQRVDELLRRQPRTGEQVGILFVDVDHLERINDEFGHAAGDGALVALAERIRSVLRADDEITRFGGDEFVVILPGVHGADDAQRIARSILDAMREPVIVGGRAMVVSVSIGVTVAEPGDTPGDVFAHADAALYRAKRSGRARAATYHPLVDEIIDLTDEDDPGT